MSGFIVYFTFINLFVFLCILHLFFKGVSSGCVIFFQVCFHFDYMIDEPHPFTFSNFVLNGTAEK